MTVSTFVIVLAAWVIVVAHSSGGLVVPGVVASVLHFLYLRATAEQDVAIGETPP